MTTPAEALMNTVEWKPVEGEIMSDDDLPYATHSGVLRIGNVELECFQLSTGERVISEESLVKFFGALADGE